MVILSNNDIWTLPADLFQNLQKLTIINLSNNRLTSLPFNIFQNSSSLGHIDLKNNDLQIIEHVVLPEYPREVTINLDGNPIDCSSRICWALYRNAVNDGACATPGTMNGRNIEELDPDDVDGCTGK